MKLYLQYYSKNPSYLHTDAPMQAWLYIQVFGMLDPIVICNNKVKESQYPFLAQIMKRKTEKS